MAGQPTGTLWLDLDITLRALDQVYGQMSESLGVNVIAWYILRVLYAQDGQRPADLVQAVGRPATSFTPVLDKLEAKGLIERRPNTSDRRSIGIHLTREGEGLRETVQVGLRLDSPQNANSTKTASIHKVGFTV